MLPEYPEHLRDRFRMSAASAFAKNELRKLFGKLNNGHEAWRAIDLSVDHWNVESEHWHLRDFWNTIDAVMMKSRLVPSLPWLTSRDVVWELRSHNIYSLRFGVLLPELQDHFQHKPTAFEVAGLIERRKDSLWARNLIRDAKRRGWEIREARNKPAIYHFKDGMLEAADGNNRLLRAILRKDTSVFAYSSRAKGDISDLREDWVPTDFLMQLVLQFRVLDPQGEAAEAVVRVAAERIRYSTAGRIELAHRAINPAYRLGERYPDREFLMRVTARLPASDTLVMQI